MTKTNETPVYDRARENIIGYAGRTDTSVGAAKKVGARSCAFAKINGVWAWHVTVCGESCCRLGPKLETIWGPKTVTEAREQDAIDDWKSEDDEHEIDW